MTLFTSYHNISHADGLFHGNSNYAAGISVWLRDGQPITAPFRYDWDNIAPAAAAFIGIVTFRTFGTSGTLGLSGSFVSTNGIAVMDVPRCVRIGGATLGTAASWLIYGTDVYGEGMIEEISTPITGVAVNGVKAFKTITCVAIKNIVSVGSSGVGRADKFGFPFAVAGVWDVLAAWADVTAQTLSTTTVTAAVATTATARSGDIRGTFNPTTASDGSVKYRVWFTALGKDTKANLYGVAQYNG